MKGGIPLSSQGTIIARVFTSNARIPLRGAQIFTEIQTLQDVQLIPTALLPELYDRTEVIDTPAQTL